MTYNVFGGTLNPTLLPTRCHSGVVYKRERYREHIPHMHATHQMVFIMILARALTLTLYNDINVAIKVNLAIAILVISTQKSKRIITDTAQYILYKSNITYAYDCDVLCTLLFFCTAFYHFHKTQLALSHSKQNTNIETIALVRAVD